MSGFAGAAFLAALPWTGGAVAAVAAVAFAVARAAGRWNVVDTAWGLFFVAFFPRPPRPSRHPS